MPMFRIRVTRVGYATRVIDVEAASQGDAQRIALDTAGNHQFTEHHAEYELAGQAPAIAAEERQTGNLLTGEQQRQYLACRGSKCPWCGSKEIEGTGQTNTDDNWHENEIACKACGAVWLDVYTITGVQGVGGPATNRRSL